LGDEPEVKGLVQGREVLIDLVAGRQMGEGVLEEGLVLREGEGFDGDEGVEQRGAETAEGPELGGPGVTELFVVEVVVVGQEGGGRWGEEGFIVSEEADQGSAIGGAEEAGDGEEFKDGGRHNVLLSFRPRGVRRGWPEPVQPWRSPLGWVFVQRPTLRQPR